LVNATRFSIRQGYRSRVAGVVVAGGGAWTGSLPALAGSVTPSTCT
jgi:hypothetical protein